MQFGSGRVQLWWEGREEERENLELKKENESEVPDFLSLAKAV